MLQQQQHLYFLRIFAIYQFIIFSSLSLFSLRICCINCFFYLIARRLFIVHILITYLCIKNEWMGNMMTFVIRLF